MSDLNVRAAEIIGIVWAEWQRVFVATQPVLIPLRVVPVPEEIPEPHPCIVLFATDADFMQISEWRRRANLAGVTVDITFNGYINRNFDRVQLTGFSVTHQKPSTAVGSHVVGGEDLWAWE